MSLKNNKSLKLHRKKPNSLSTKNNTWSSSTTTCFLKKEDSRHVQLSLMSIQHRIEMYEKKFKQCMESRTELSNWIKSSKEKGLPIPLTEGYIPPPPLPPSPPTTTTTRTRLPDLFSSLSTRQKQCKSSMDASAPVTTKSSISTFLKKATDSLSMQPLKRQQQTTTTNTNRFSLNRFSLPKNSSYTSMTEKYHSNATTTSTSTNSSNRERSNKKKSNRFSSPPPLPNNHFNQYQNQRKQQYNISPPSLIQSSNPSVIPVNSKSHKKPRPQSSILPSSPSSIFLDRLRSRTSCYDVSEEKECQIIQPNITTTTNKQVYYPSIYTIVDNYNNLEDVITPPSSPSSIESTTPPLSRQSQDTHSSSCSSTSSSDQPFHHISSLPTIKKKRTSLLVSPSLSTMRLISQKSQFLKRQSMYA